MLDTSVFIATESGRPLGAVPAAAAISVITLAELHLGVLMAERAAVRNRRLRTLLAVQDTFEPIPIDAEIARAFAEIVAAARALSRRPKIMDTWIAATAVARDLPLYTQDEDFLSIPRVHVVRV
ncbi:MAG TPA: PIN domain-containing protein [Candidatus Binataceae bacterium]|nr:PIN domain-containing protein [Candidatus Binataceae bacterium]